MVRLFIFLWVVFAPTVHADSSWQFETGGMVTGKAVVHQNIIYVTGGTRLYALNKNGGKQGSYDAGAMVAPIW